MDGTEGVAAVAVWLKFVPLVVKECINSTLQEKLPIVNSISLLFPLEKFIVKQHGIAWVLHDACLCGSVWTQIEGGLPLPSLWILILFQERGVIFPFVVFSYKN